MDWQNHQGKSLISKDSEVLKRRHRTQSINDIDIWTIPAGISDHVITD